MKCLFRVLLLLASSSLLGTPRVGDTESSVLKELGPVKSRLQLPDDRTLYYFERGTVICKRGRVVELQITSDADEARKRQEAQALEAQRKANEAWRLEAEKRQREETQRRQAEEARKQTAEEEEDKASILSFGKVAKGYIDEIVAKQVIGLEPKAFGVSSLQMRAGDDNRLLMELSFKNEGPIKVTSLVVDLYFVDNDNELVAEGKARIALDASGKVVLNLADVLRVDYPSPANVRPRVYPIVRYCAQLKALKQASGVLVSLEDLAPAGAAQALEIKESSLWIFRKQGERPRIVADKPGTTPEERASFGSGMVFTREGHVFTNAHVVDRAAKFFVVRYEDGKIVSRLPAQILAKDREADLAILKVDGWTPPAGPPSVPPLLASSENAKMGDSIFVLGFPLPGTLSSNIKFTKGDISDLSGPDDDKSKIQHTAPIQPGNSGGPMCLADGRVIGIVVSSLSHRYTLNTSGSLPQGVNFSIKSDHLLKLAEDSGIKFTRGQAAGTEGAVEHVKAYTVQIMCTD